MNQSKLKMRHPKGDEIEWTPEGGFRVTAVRAQEGVARALEALFTEALAMQPYASHLPAVEVARRAALSVIPKLEVVEMQGMDENLTPEEGMA